jgi:hypothetical protein
MSDKVTHSDFEDRVGATFRVETSQEESQDLTLIEIVALPSRPGAGRGDPFSLVFRGPMSRGLEQKIHRLSHAEMGAIDLFLVPIGPEGDPDGTHYQAIFN